MRCIRERVVRFVAAHLITVFFIMVFVAIPSRPALTSEHPGDQKRTKQNRDADNPLIEFGRSAPDFELPRLTFKTDAAGKTIGLINEESKIRLSSFRGKKPVCLIMSSYT